MDETKLISHQYRKIKLYHFWHPRRNKNSKIFLLFWKTNKLPLRINSGWNLKFQRTYCIKSICSRLSSKIFLLWQLSSFSIIQTLLSMGIILWDNICTFLPSSLRETQVIIQKMFKYTALQTIFRKINCSYIIGISKYLHFHQFVSECILY